MILYELGKTLSARVVDTCDASPTFAIDDVHANQPALGGGSGNTSPDVLFGKNALCVRSERAGTSQSPREYTVRVVATDASLNQAFANTLVRVGHDQGSSCPAIDPARIVDDGDPRCTR